MRLDSEEQKGTCSIKVNLIGKSIKLRVDDKERIQNIIIFLIEIEKTELIDIVNQPVPDFTTAGNASFPPYFDGKNTKFISNLQINSSKIVDVNGGPLV